MFFWFFGTLKYFYHATFSQKHSKEQSLPLHKRVIIFYLLQRQYKNRFQPNEWQSKWKEYTELMPWYLLPTIIKSNRLWFSLHRSLVRGEYFSLKRTGFHKKTRSALLNHQFSSHFCKNISTLKLTTVWTNISE